MNYNLHSTSISFGGNGFRTTYSSTGRVTRSVGIPGTGLSYVTTSNSRSPSRSRTNNDAASIGRTAAGVGLFAGLTRPQTARTATQAVSVEPPAPVVDIDAVRERIQAIYRFADNPVNWKKILVSQEDFGIDHWDYFKQRAEDVLNGDLDTYFEIISDINPVDDLLQYGSEFECGTDDPRMMVVEFKVNSKAVLHDEATLPSTVYNDLLQDYVCGCAIRVARDILALLPLRHIIINAYDHENAILSVDFDRASLNTVDFERADASDTVERFQHRMSFSLSNGFAKVQALDTL